MDKTLIKGLRVLECVAGSSEPRGASDLAAELGMTKSNAYRTLQTLVSMKFLHHRPGRGTYEPTLRLFELGMKVGGRLGVRTAALPILRELVERTGENASVAVLDDREVVYVERLDSPNPVRSVVRVGERLPAHCTAAGKALLAWAPEEIVESMAGLLHRHTEHTITDMEGLRAELACVRETGFASARGEWHLTVTCVAVPVRNRSGEVIAAINVSGPTARFGTAQMKKNAAAARWGAEQILEQLT